MRKMIRINRHRYSLQALLVMLLLVILMPVLLMQYYSYNWGAELISQSLADSASANVSYLREAFSERITSIVEQQEYLLTAYYDVSSYLTYARKVSRSERYVMESRLVNDIRNICYGHPLIQSFTLFYPTLNRQFSISYINDSPGLVQNISDIGDTGGLVQEYEHRSSVVSCDGNELYLIHGLRIGDGLPQYLTRAVLGTDSIEELLGAYGVYPSQKAYLLHWDSGHVVSSSNQSSDLDNKLSVQFTPQKSSKVYRVQFSNSATSYTAFCADIPQFGVTFIHLIDNQTLDAVPEQLRFMIIMAFLLTLLVALLYAVAVHYIVHRPVRALMDCFEAAGQGDLEKKMKPYPTKEFLALSSGYNAMADKLEHLINEHYQQTILLQQAQLRQLHSQIEPHFLYNSFFMLRHTIASEEVEKAEKICDHLGNYFKFITKLDSQLLTLEEEYNNVMNYIAIQAMRFTGRLRMEIEPLPDALAPCIVPVLILQPLIENAIEHGIPPQNALLRLSFRDDGEDYMIMVEDNGSNLTDERIAELNDQLHRQHGAQGTHALPNIHDRLLLHYGAGYGLVLSIGELGGLCVTMRLKKTLQQTENKGKEV